MRELYIILGKIGWTWFAVVALLFLVHVVYQFYARNQRARRLRRGFAVKDDGKRGTSSHTR
jgi:hypothetical protein